MKTTPELIEDKLRENLDPETLSVIDDRAEHIGHAHEDSGHFTVHIVSPFFTGKNAVARHRLVYQALGSLMQSHIHALRIEARAPNET